MITKKKNESIGQPEINIGLVGHIDHGKTSLVKQLTGKWTDTHSEEIKRGITIRLGYADAVFYYCKKCDLYMSDDKCSNCKNNLEVLRKVSFVDTPGHETLMATMLSGAAIMDGAILLVAANEECPQPQTREHLTALEIIGIKNIVIVQNKIDLVNKEKAVENYKQIKKFVDGSVAENAPIIPISAQHNVNIDLLIKAIEDVIKTPKRDDKKVPLMLVARSFDINRPGTEVNSLVGGVLGGALRQGKLILGDIIEIKPGRKVEKQGKIIWESIITVIKGLKSGGNTVDSVGPGGSIGVLTDLDPFVVKSDSLVGAIVGNKDGLPPVWKDFSLKVSLLDRVVGSKEELKVEPIKKGEILMLNVNSAVSAGIVDNAKDNIFHINLKLPVCCDKKDRIVISRKIGNRFRLIGIAEIK